jgi:flagellar biosynthesis/type III secretory pathway protein FliH
MSIRIFKQAGAGISSVCFPDVACAVLPGTAGRLEETQRAAEQKARDIVEKAMAEAEQLRAAALEEGRARAEKIYAEPLLAALAALAAAKAALENAQQAALAGAEKEMVRLVMRIAEKVIRRRLDSDGDEVFLMISRAIQAVPKGKTLLIRVNEKDYESIQKAGAAIPTAAKLAGTLSLEVSAEVEPGGCIIMTEAGAVNANPSRQLELIEEALLKETPCEL